jgi:predicted nucleic acid-binding protein
MKLFLDTSSLFKLYYLEMDSSIIERVFTDYKVTDVFLSELTKIEFASTVWKKVRKQDITELQAKAVIEAFEEDYSKYIFVQIDNMLIEQAKSLVTKYGKQGLRALDSIQLSTAVILGGRIDLFLSSDKLLNSFLKFESLPTERSNEPQIE